MRLRVGRRSRAVRLAATALTLAGCFVRTATPTTSPGGPLAGRCKGGLDAATACGEWQEATTSCGEGAAVHDAFAELVPASCYVRVHYDAADGEEARQTSRLPRAEAIPAGCGYPDDRAAVTAELLVQAARYDRVAQGDDGDLPMAVACELPGRDREVTARANAATLRAVAGRITRRRYPYAAAATFGFGHGVMDGSVLVPWRPGQACPVLDKREMDRLGINRLRASRASAAVLAGIAPAMIVSGGAVHASLYEAFMHHFLATCVFGVRPDAVLLDPCADHTHTNIKHTGSLVIQLGGRTAYVVTDDGLQAKYLQERTAFDVIGGAIDDRALRDWGYLLGSWRQASVGIDAGYWYTPYRFWAEPRDGLGSFTCLR